VLPARIAVAAATRAGNKVSMRIASEYMPVGRLSFGIKMISLVHDIQLIDDASFA